MTILHNMVTLGYEILQNIVTLGYDNITGLFAYKHSLLFDVHKHTPSGYALQKNYIHLTVYLNSISLDTSMIKTPAKLPLSIFIFQ